MGIKKGVPLYSNLVNLKSNTMKNTILNSIWHSYSFAVYFLNLR